MEADELTQQTQGVVDPRRLGRNNSGLSVEDISDVMCILHPCTPAAFKLVAETAKYIPQHILQNKFYVEIEPDATLSMIENQETFILPTGERDDNSNTPMDLALRFSTDTVNPVYGFTFGRNRELCDIVVPTDTHKRISNMHFSISMNYSGVLMLTDMSTNGTMVDEVLLKGKNPSTKRTRMLNPGSIIQILSLTTEESLKFIVRIPSREGHVDEYETKFQAYMRRVALAQARFGPVKDKHLLAGPQEAQPRTQSVAVKAPLVHKQYGMHWSGGDKYNVVGQIGKGAFASVYQLATKSDGDFFAAKELEKRKFMKNGILDRKLDNEMQIMKSISHPNIVQYVDYVDFANHLYIIMEFVMCGDVQQHLSHRGPMAESMVNRMAAQVFDALVYLHEKQITHRDIKPDNILIANLDPNNFTVKLSDFGLSKVVKDNETFLKTFCGTLLYCAPEVFPDYDDHVIGKGIKRPRSAVNQPPVKFHSYSQSVDIWSFGAVLWYSLCCKPPFEGVAGANGAAMFQKIMSTSLDAADLVQRGVSEEAISLLSSMLQVEPARRPSAWRCLHSAWFGHASQSKQLEQPVVSGLGAIAEEVEREPGAEPDVASLSLDEFQSSAHGEVSLNSGDLNFFDPRQSKRFKPDMAEYREHESAFDSSSDIFHQSIPTVNHKAEPPAETSESKLFGEISESDLLSSAFNRRANDAVGNPVGLDGADDRIPSNLSKPPANPSSSAVQASPSLLGAESLVRDLHMRDSPLSNGSPSPGGSRPRTPGSADRPGEGSGKNTSEKDAPGGSVEITPKPIQRPKWDRQINIAIPPSFWWDPNDPSTHTVEYASKAAGHDLAANPNYFPSNESLPATRIGSAVDHQSDASGEESTTVPPPPPVVYPTLPTANPPEPLPRYGRLISTPDSYASVRLDLNTRSTSWGRGPDNTYIYPDKFETRVPKTGIVIFFHAPGIDSRSRTSHDPSEGGGDVTAAAAADDWSHLPGLYCGVLTYSSYGLVINGVALKRSEPDAPTYGRIRKGDEIVVWPAGRDGKPGLKFIVDLYVGEGQTPRTPHEPPFTVVSVQNATTTPPAPTTQAEPGHARDKGKKRALPEAKEMAEVTAA